MMLLPRFKWNETKVILIITTVGDPRQVRCALNTNQQRKLWPRSRSPKHLAEKNAEFTEPQGKEVREKGQKGKKKKKHYKNLEQPVDGAIDSLLSNFVQKEPTTLAPETSLEHTGSEWEVQIFRSLCFTHTLWLPLHSAEKNPEAEKLCKRKRRCAHSFVSLVVSNSATLWTAAHQAPLPVGFPRQEYWVGCHFPLKEIFPLQGDQTHVSHVSLHCRRILHPLSHQESPKRKSSHHDFTSMCNAQVTK